LTGNNVLRFALLDLSDSFSDVSSTDCDCGSMKSLFGGLKYAVAAGQIASKVI
jgi:hypothetical protein